VARQDWTTSWKIVVLSLILILKPVFVQAGVHTFRVDEHEKVCFGYYLEQDSGEASGDMQVSRGGDAKINWKILDPNGKELLSQDHVSDAEFTFDVKDGGDYKICLDNSFDSESKIVTLALDHHLPDEMTLLFEKLSKNQDNMKGPPNFVKKSELLLKNAEKLLRFHEIYAAKQKRHYFLVGSNLSRVNGFSLLSCGIMIGVGILQVFIVKGLFEDGSKRKFKLWS